MGVIAAYAGSSSLVWDRQLWPCTGSTESHAAESPGKSQWWDSDLVLLSQSQSFPTIPHPIPWSFPDPAWWAGVWCSHVGTGLSSQASPAHLRAARPADLSRSSHPCPVNSPCSSDPEAEEANTSAHALVLPWGPGGWSHLAGHGSERVLRL